MTASAVGRLWRPTMTAVKMPNVSVGQHFAAHVKLSFELFPNLSLRGRYAQYTPPTPTRRNCFVASASAVWTQFATSSRRQPTDSVDNLETDQTDPIAFDYTNLIDIDNFFNNDVIMSLLLKKLSTSIKIHVVKQPWSLFGQFPNCRPNPSAVVVS